MTSKPHADAQGGSRSEAPKRTDFTNLDFMRSIAVLLVVSSHLLLYLGRASWDGWSGITGVCMFFVHTTLVLMWSLERDGDVGRFYLRRAFRIYPLWLAVLFLTLALRIPMSPLSAPGFGFHSPTHRELIDNVLLIFNLREPAAIVGASWTLPLEVDMYLFLPCLFFFARQLRSVWPLLVITFFVIQWDRVTLPAYNSSLPMCVPYFLPGVMAFVLYKRRSLPKLPGWCFAVFLLALAAIDHSFGSFRGSWIFCLLLGLAIPFFRDMTSRPIRLASHYVARYSYGIYLTHIISITVAVHTLRGQALFLRLSVFFALLIGLPIVFYHLVEEPMIRLGSRLAKKIGRGPGTKVSGRELELEMAP